MCKYVHSHNLQLDKLLVKALKCVFVGYSNTQKGYWCYHLRTRKVLVTKDETRLFYQIKSETREEREEIRMEGSTLQPQFSIIE